MIVVKLIENDYIYNLQLPEKVKGRYWLTDKKNGKERKLISIEAEENRWYLHSSRLAKIQESNEENKEKIQLSTFVFIEAVIKGENKRIIIFAEEQSEGINLFEKYVVSKPLSFSIGRSEGNAITYDCKYISGHHAQLIYDGNEWSVLDNDSSNGLFVNDRKVKSGKLSSGDVIYIWGLVIIIGDNFIAVNNPYGRRVINTDELQSFSPQEMVVAEESENEEEKQYFYRSPRLKRGIEHKEIKIDSPPQQQKMETMPLALVLGPSITMAMASVGTASFSIINVINNNGKLINAMPTLTMAFSMLLGMILWPVLTKKYEKKQRIKNEKKRQEKYLKYLDETKDNILKLINEQSEILKENIVTAEECKNRIINCDNTLWERMPSHDDFLQVRIGIGDVPLDADIVCQEKRFSLEDDNLWSAMMALGFKKQYLSNVPIGLDIRKEKIVGIVGEKEKRKNLIKSIMVQLLALHGYDQMKFIAIVEPEKEWEFLKYVPHIWNNERTERYYAETSEDMKELGSLIERNILIRTDDERNKTDDVPYYVIFCINKQLSDSCEQIKKLLSYKNDRGFGIVFQAEDLKMLPKETNTIISLDIEENKMFDKNDMSGNVIGFESEYFDESFLDNDIKKISEIKLDIEEDKYALKDMVTFMEMYDVSKVEHLNVLERWKENNPIKTLQAPVGIDQNGDLIYLDLHERFHGPHGLIAGMTGSGKSEFIITYILSLAINYRPDEVSFVLIDYKGGGLTGAFDNKENGMHLPHLVGTITNLDGSSIKRSLVSLNSELKRRQEIFNRAKKITGEGTMDIYAYQKLYREGVVKEPVPHLFVISDEFAELKSQQREFMDELISAARIGRSLGVHLILATQKPNGVVDDQIWSNTKFRVCLKVQDKADSMDMIKRQDAAELSKTGRFYLQVGYDELFVLGQSAYCGADYEPEQEINVKEKKIRVIDNQGRDKITVKAGRRKDPSKKNQKQIVTIIKYLTELAKDENINVKPLWLEPIEKVIYADDLKKKYGYSSQKFILEPVIGEYDDPDNQRQNILTMEISQKGHYLIYGYAGSGEEQILYMVAFELIREHSAEEVNIYIMDFGAETLKALENAPQVGDVMLAQENEKINNFINMIKDEINIRRKLFSQCGGSFETYIAAGKETMPNIVVLVNNYIGLVENFPSIKEELQAIIRDCSRYGIYFIVTSTTSVGYRMEQNFKNIMTLQLNDEMDYSMYIGKTNGVYPMQCYGRGLVSLDKVYEYQTAYIYDYDKAKELDYIKEYCENIKDSYGVRAKKVPVLPEYVTKEIFDGQKIALNRFPVGVGKDKLEPVYIDFYKKPVFMIAAQEKEQLKYFAKEFIKIASDNAEITDIVDMADVLENQTSYGVDRKDICKYVDELFTDMLNRLNDNKQKSETNDTMSKHKKRVIVFTGVKQIIGQLEKAENGKVLRDKFEQIIECNKAEFKTYVVVIDEVQNIKEYTSKMWFRKNIDGDDGLWIGNGVANQNIFKTPYGASYSADLESHFGYVFVHGKPVLTKILEDKESEGDE